MGNFLRPDTPEASELLRKDRTQAVRNLRPGRGRVGTAGPGPRCEDSSALAQALGHVLQGAGSQVRPGPEGARGLRPQLRSPGGRAPVSGPALELTQCTAFL